jgi:hypothetical protein
MLYTASVTAGTDPTWNRITDATHRCTVSIFIATPLLLRLVVG